MPQKLLKLKTNLFCLMQKILVQDQDKKKNLTKADFDYQLKSLNQKINSNKTRRLLVENEFKKLKIFNSIYFRNESYFKEDGMQNCSVFQPIYRYFEIVIGVSVVTIFNFGNLKGCLMKMLQLLLQVIIALIYN